MGELAFYSLSLVLLLGLSAFFSASEAALFSLNRAQVQALAEQSAAGRRIARLLEEPRKLLVSILLGNLVVNIFATSTATAICLQTFGERGLGYAFVVMSILIVAFGEIFPKAVALRWAEKAAPVVIFPLQLFHRAVLPIRVPLSQFSDAVIDYLRRRLGAPKRQFTWDELITALRISRHEGTVGVFEYELLSNVLSFRSKIVKEIMTPSIHVLSSSVRTGRNELISRFSRSGHSRMPIHERNSDEIIGVLHVKDLVDPRAASTEADLRGRLRAPYFVRESAAINELYNEFQKRKLHIAVVLDEYSSFAGIVTIEDILEELVGDIRDARDPKTLPYMRLDERRIVVAGTMEIDDFNDVMATSIEDDEHETIAGYVLGETGRIPKEGETIVIGDLRFHVVSAQAHRIRKMRVERA